MDIDDEGYVELNREFAEHLATNLKRRMGEFSNDDIVAIIEAIGQVDMDIMGDGDERVGRLIVGSAQLTMVTYLCLEEFDEEDDG